MTVLPNAQIDAATGLSVPTIAVATAAGVSVIKDDGTVVDIASDGQTGGGVDELDFYNNSQLIVTWDSVGSGTRNTYSYNIPASDTTASASPIARYVDSTTAGGTRLYFSTDAARALKTVGFKDKKNFVLVPNSFNPSIVIVDEDQTGNEGANGMIAYATTLYNTGYMHGSIKGAFLSDTDDTDKTNGQTDPDRSANNNALTVNGTITKSAVATGADLVGYSGFSASNYLLQTDNNDLDFGTGDLYMIFWHKKTNSSANEVLFEKKDDTTGGNGATLGFQHHNNGYNCYVTGGAGGPGGTNDYLTGSYTTDSQWHCVAGVRSGGVLTIYVDGKSIVSAVRNYNVNNTGDLYIGSYIGAGTATAQTSTMALLRIGGSAPTAEQIKKIYEDEKVLFQENAKATLYGSSDAVTALAYDDTTELLHVGTSAGRSDFQGLRRINNTTTAVTAAISASNGLVTEQ
tara:strand:- start:7 stop:1383 length:1377 start_codon:yes stop_codon:yes gene_type:complete